MRANIAREMAAINGFEILFRVLRGPDVPWLGADTLSILLKAFSEVSAIPSECMCNPSMFEFDLVEAVLDPLTSSSSSSRSLII